MCKLFFGAHKYLVLALFLWAFRSHKRGYMLNVLAAYELRNRIANKCNFFFFNFYFAQNLERRKIKQIRRLKYLQTYISYCKGLWTYILGSRKCFAWSATRQIEYLFLFSAKNSNEKYLWKFVLGICVVFYCKIYRPDDNTNTLSLL